MIAWVEGVLREKAPTRVVLDVGGVGYELMVSLGTFEALPETGKTISLHVRTVVREDAFLLYGFHTRTERACFDLLLKANRVGPKLAQAILSGLEPARLLRALRDGDVKVLKRAPGVGAKMAERMGFDLREGAAELLDAEGEPRGEAGGGRDEAHGDTEGELLSALVNLGYAQSQAEKMARAAADEAGEGASIETLIRVALRRLAP